MEKKTKNIEQKAPSRKRSSYKRNAFDLPDWAKKDAKHSYRWEKASTFEEEAGYGAHSFWEPVNDPNGKKVRYKEMILCKMPKEEFNEMLQEEREEARSQIEAVTSKHAEEVNRLNHEVKKMGGRVKFSVDVN